MAKCDNCGCTILFGGKRNGTLRFCNARCAANGGLLARSLQIPESVVNESVMRIHQGLCPKCGGSGPVDIHIRHRVWSAVFLTSWKSTPQICCRGCGTNGQLGDAAFSLVLGWWGIPWGVLWTPVQIGRNVFGIVKGPDPTKPSAQLEKVVRMNIASQALEKERAQNSMAASATK